MLQDGTFRNRSLPKTMDGVWIRRCRRRIVSKKGGSGFVNGAGLILGNDNPISKALSNIPILGPILMFVMMNQDRSPAVDYNLSFPNQQFSRAYRAAATFSEKFYAMDQIITQSNITPLDFKDLFPIFVYDVSKQSERLKSSVVDIQIKST